MCFRDKWHELCLIKVIPIVVCNLSRGVVLVVKEGVIRCLLYTLTVVWGVACSFVVSASEEVIFAAGEYPPYVSESAEGYGIAAQIVGEACRRANLTLTLKFMPWSRAEHDTAESKYLGSISWVRTPEREKRFAYSRYPIVLGGTPSVAFYKRSMFPKPPVINSWADFAKLDVVGVNSYWYKEFLEQAGVKAFYVNSAELAWKLLELDRKAIFIDSLATGLIESKKYIPKQAGDIAYVSLEFDKNDGYIIYPLNNPDAAKIRDKLDVALEAMTKDGTIRRMNMLNK